MNVRDEQSLFNAIDLYTYVLHLSTQTPADLRAAY